MAVKRVKSPYRKGYLKELEVMRILKDSGKFQVVFRSAGGGENGFERIGRGA